MILNMAGGGGTSLNFTVVGGTSQPSSPKENTIWVNTSTTITSWVFSAEQPSSPKSGMVWIQTGDSSNVAFNALKKNNLQVYPLSAKQYVGYSWVTKTVKVYQSGTWAESWNGQLYDSGNEYTSITGGWTISGKGSKNASTITVGSSTQPTTPSTATTGKTINLANFDTVEVNFSEIYSGTSGNRFALNILDSSKNVLASATKVISKNILQTLTLSVDVSEINEDCYVQVSAAYTGSGSSDEVYGSFSNARCY